MEKNIGIFFLFGLLSSSLSFSTEQKLTKMEQITITMNEISHYFGAMLPFYTALESFRQKHTTNTPEIACKFCPERSLSCDELIVKLQAKAMDRAIDAQASVAYEARKNMLAIYHEITRLLCVGSIDDIRKFMAKIAHEGAIPCEDCQKVKWQTLGVSKYAQ